MASPWTPEKYLKALRNHYFITLKRKDGKIIGSLGKTKCTVSAIKTIAEAKKSTKRNIDSNTVFNFTFRLKGTQELINEVLDDLMNKVQIPIIDFSDEDAEAQLENISQKMIRDSVKLYTIVPKAVKNVNYCLFGGPETGEFSILPLLQDSGAENLWWRRDYNFADFTEDYFQDRNQLRYMFVQDYVMSLKENQAKTDETGETLLNFALLSKNFKDSEIKVAKSDGSYETLVISNKATKSKNPRISLANKVKLVASGNLQLNTKTGGKKKVLYLNVTGFYINPNGKPVGITNIFKPVDHTKYYVNENIKVVASLIKEVAQNTGFVSFVNKFYPDQANELIRDFNSAKNRQLSSRLSPKSSRSPRGVKELTLRKAIDLNIRSGSRSPRSPASSSSKYRSGSRSPRKVEEESRSRSSKNSQRESSRSPSRNVSRSPSRSVSRSPSRSVSRSPVREQQQEELIPAKSLRKTTIPRKVSKAVSPLSSSVKGSLSK